MEEILHHLGCIKPCKYGDKQPINWCRISEPSTVLGSKAMVLPWENPMGKPIIHKSTKNPPRSITFLMGLVVSSEADLDRVKDLTPKMAG